MKPDCDKLLLALKRRATEASALRGHEVAWARPWHGESRSEQQGTCRVCGMSALVGATHHAPDGYLAGAAVRLNCNDPGNREPTPEQAVDIIGTCDRCGATGQLVRREDPDMRDVGMTGVVCEPCADEIDNATGDDLTAIVESHLALRHALAELLEMCRWKCSPRDEVLLSNGRSNHEALVKAQRVLVRAEEVSALRGDA